ncbi:UNVERIFIED_ORG: hypothetical protein BTE55_17050 [Rhizobium sophorae]|nr:hypothetical protein ATY29_06070 [Rhizobium hidalgonense]
MLQESPHPTDFDANNGVGGIEAMGSRQHVNRNVVGLDGIVVPFKPSLHQIRRDRAAALRRLELRIFQKAAKLHARRIHAGFASPAVRSPAFIAAPR